MSVETYLYARWRGDDSTPSTRRHMGLGVNQRNLLVPAVHRDDAKRHVPHRRRLEPRHGELREQLQLRRVLPDTFNEVVVGRAVVGHPMADLRYYMFRVGVVQRSQGRGLDLTKFEALETTSFFEYPPHLA